MLEKSNQIIEYELELTKKDKAQLKEKFKSPSKN